MKRQPAGDGRRNILILLWATGASERDFLLGFSRFARQRPGWNINLLRARESFSSREIAAIESGEYHGIVTDEATLAEHPAIRPSKRTALAVLGTRPKRCPYVAPRVSYIENDNIDIGRLGARHFLGLGRFRTYGFVQTAIPHDWALRRAEGFASALAAAGRQCAIYAPGAAAEPLADWIRRLPKPAALMVAWDNIALEAAAAARRAGCPVPGQVAILGVDNDDILCNFSSPSISSIGPDHGENGHMAAEELDGWMAGRFRGGARRRVCTGKTLVERESTAPLSPAAHLVLAAAEFIRRNATRNIKVPDVAAFLGVSRRLLDLRFAEIGGATIRETIIENRLGEVRRLLLSTAMPVVKIARACEFPSVSRLETLFSARYGASLQKWREENAAAGTASPPRTKA